MNDDLWRIASLLELALLFGLKLGWHLAHRDHVPRPFWLIGWGYVGVLTTVAVAITLNATSGAPLTVGQKVVTLGLALPAAWVAAVTLREARSYARRAAAVMHKVHNLGDPPCDHPGCWAARDDLRAAERGDSL